MTPKELKVFQYMCKHGKDGMTGIEVFTRYIYKEFYNRKFNVSDHHKAIWQKLQDVVDGKCNRLIINIQPRLGKTEIAVKMFIAYGLAMNPKSKFIHLSYSDDLALENSEFARDYVKSEAFQSIFPSVIIKKDSDSKKKWYTTESGGVYATAAGGQVTGFGAGIVETKIDHLEGDDFLAAMAALGENLFGGAIIIDDPLKPDDADSEINRERVNARFDSTISNRINSRKTPIIVIMQRLHERDLCGHLLADEGWELLCLPSIKEDGEAIYPHYQTKTELLKIRDKNPIIFERQYMQNPKPIEGMMYQSLKTYDTIPITTKRVYKNYTDTADMGSDYLCSINYIETEIGCYITDVLYTKLSMDSTCGMLAKMLLAFDSKGNQKIARIESNNGGRIFATNVERDLRLLGDSKTKITWFHQMGNKQARIANARYEVSNLIYFPTGWEHKFPNFYLHVTSHRAEGQKNQDDAADALTGMIEDISKKIGKIMAWSLN